jgi:aminoglycoside phosphotransferase (APT) family kinase protein
MSTRSDPHARVTAVFPQLGARDVRPIGTGWTVDTYEVDGDWIVQFPRDARAAERLRAQIATLPELAAELSALVPEPTHVDDVLPAIAYRKIEGAPLDEAPDGLWPERLGRFLYDLHLMPPEYVGLRGGGAADTRAAHRTELDAFRERVLPLLEPGEAEHIGARFSTYLDDDDLWRFAPCLTHGDIGPEHVLVSAHGDLVGVLDWEELTVDDPVADFAWLLNERPEQGERALAAYGGAPDPAFLVRGSFRWALMPFHEVVHGLDSGRQGFVATGIAGIRRRVGGLELRG